MLRRGRLRARRRRHLRRLPDPFLPDLRYEVDLLLLRGVAPKLRVLVTGDERRHVAMLALVIGSRGEGVTVAELRAALPYRLRVHLRSLQRDLHALAKWAPIAVDARAKPYRWRRVRRAACPCCQRVLP